MVKNLIGSFSENLMEKSRNPFLGTYALVWLIRNWVIVYTLFNFDKELNMQDRIDFISCYFSNKPFLENLVINIIWALGLLVLTYFLLNVSRTIVNFSEKVITPLVYKFTDKGSIVLKKDYNVIVQLLRESEEKRDKEIQKRIEADKRAEEFENKLSEKQVSEKKNNPSEIEKRYAKILEKGFVPSFKDIAFRLKSGNKKYKGKDENAHEFFITSNLIELETQYMNGDKDWQLTSIGEELLSYIVSQTE